MRQASRRHAERGNPVFNERDDVPHRGFEYFIAAVANATYGRLHTDMWLQPDTL